MGGMHVYHLLNLKVFLVKALVIRYYMLLDVERGLGVIFLSI